MTAAHNFDSTAFRRALGNFATGITVVTATTPSGERVGVTANSFNSVSLDPPLVLWSIDKKSGSYPIFDAASHFAVNILAADQMHLSNNFAKRSEDKFANIDYQNGLGGAAILPDCAAVFECERYACLEGGDHWIMVGKVERFSDNGRAPLLFHQGGYSLVMPAESGSQQKPNQVCTEINDKLASNLFFLMLQAVRHYQSDYQPKQLATGLRTSEARILMSLHSCGELTQEQLAIQVSMPQADTLSAFAVLKNKALISLDGDSYCLKPEGAKMAEQLWQIAQDEQQQQFGHFSDTEIATFKRILLSLIGSS
jgi:4-hydroxyphenylacetate 3-hydroxylase, reductase component